MNAGNRPWAQGPGWLAGLLLVCLAAITPALADNAPLIRLEAAAGQPGQGLPLRHPAVVEPDLLASLLDRLEYAEAGLFGRTTSRKVFSADELSALAPALADALGRASSSEQVRFASFSRRSGVLGQQLKTEAVTFVDAGGQLNLAFTDIHAFAGPDEDYFAFLDLGHRDPLAIDSSLLRLDSSDAAWSPIADRPLWARADLSVATTPASAPPESSARETSETAAEAPSAPAPPATGQPHAESAEAQAVDRLESQVRQRLEFLRALYEDGLITEDEFQEQRREALRRLD